MCIRDRLKGTLDGMDTTVITELSEYFEKELGYVQPSRTPFVGRNFNVTRAGIHADGLLKNEEIYNPDARIPLNAPTPKLTVAQPPTMIPISRSFPSMTPIL